MARFSGVDRIAISALIAAYHRGEIRSSSTMDTYTDAIFAIVSNCLAPGGSLLTSLHREPKALRDRIRRKYPNVSTYLTRLDGIMALYNFCPDGMISGGAKVEAFWRAERNKAANERNDLAKNNVMTEKLRGNTLYLDDLDRAIGRILNGDPPIGRSGMQSDPAQSWKGTSNMQHLWLVIARHVPPKRRDYGRVRVVRAMKDVDPRENAIVVPRSNSGVVKLALGNYKNDRYGGQYTEDLPANVAQQVRESLRDIPRKYLFVKRDLEPMGDEYFGEWVTRTFKLHLGKHATANALRRAWVREEADPRLKTIAEREELARKMNHSITTQMQSYSVVDR